MEKNDPQVCLDLATSLVSKYKPTQHGSASGKFSQQYSQYLFHKSSSVPLIRFFSDKLESQLQVLSEKFGKPFSFEWVYLAQVLDPSQKFCIPHKDGFWMDGQAHLTISGEANIDVWRDIDPYENPQAPYENIKVPNGTLWYLNGSSHWHRANPFELESELGRLEVLAPINPNSTEAYFECLKPGPEKMIDPECKEWKNIKKKHIEIEKKAQGDNSSSSPFNLDYIKDIGD